jgi:hypothetical protein
MKHVKATVDSVEGGAFMISTEEKEGLLVQQLVAEQQADRFDALSGAVDVVP